MNKETRILVQLCCVLALACLGLGLEYAQVRKEIHHLLPLRVSDFLAQIHGATR